MSNNCITLVGAGLAGSLLSIYLAKRGFDVEVYERRSDMRAEEISAGRSINLALSTRGIHALDEVGLKQEIMRIAIPMKGRMVHDLNGELAFHRYGKDDTEVINSVSRGELNMKLMTEAEKQGVQIHFNRRCTGIDFGADKVIFQDTKSKAERKTRASVVIGTDGSASAIRNDMQREDKCAFSQDFLEHGYKELTIPPGTNGAFQLEKNALHIWPRGAYMLIALPNLDGSFTCTLFFAFEGQPSFARLQTEADVSRFFEAQFPDAAPLMPTLVEDFFANPTGKLATVKCQPWHVAGSVCLLGDAAHAIVPFFGQGMNCAFEDCTVLNECIGKLRPDWASIFEKFEALRKVNADAIADLALANYHEMRDHVADPKFQLKRQVEFALEEKYPGVFIPRYSMVSFHRIPYSVAKSRGEIQADILHELCDPIDTLEQVDWMSAERLIRDKLQEKVLDG